MEGYFVVMSNSLVPDQDGLRKWIEGHQGEVVYCKIENSRSLQQHRRYWQMLTVYADNCDDMTPQKLHALTKYALGYYEIIKFKDKEILNLESISFDKMSQKKAGEYYKQAEMYLQKEFKYNWEDGQC